MKDTRTPWPEDRAVTACDGELSGATLTEPSRRIPVVGDYDVCVLGGSCTGVFAAVRAAQTGARVALVEKQNAFGGVAASGLVNVWHKLRDNTDTQQIIGGLTEAVVDRLGQIGGVDRDANGVFSLNTEELKIELDRLVLEHEITPYLHTVYAAPNMIDGRVAAVYIENKDGRQAIRAKTFVDATGDGDLARDVGLPYAIRDGLQPPTTCANIAGLPDAISGLIATHRDEFDLAPDHGWGRLIPGTPGVRMCAFTHVFNTLASDATALTAAEIEGRRQIRAYMDIARKYGDRQNEPALLNLSSYIGVRETRSFTANYTLTEEDVMTGKRFPDAIANGTYPIDVHDPQTGKFKFKRLTCDFYQIPLSTMLSNRAENIVLAGRIISADRSAFGAIRVMVNLNQVGEAAGVTAALAAGSGMPISDLDAGAVRNQLLTLGAKVV